MAPKKQQPLPLSPNELKVLQFIEQFIEERQVAPTFQEIKEHFGFASFNSVQRYLKQLQDKNYIHVPGGNQKRAMQLLNSSTTFSNSLQERISAPAGSPKNPPFPTQSLNPQRPPFGRLMNLAQQGQVHRHEAASAGKKGLSPLTESPPTAAEVLSLPLLGRVAAGSPIEAFLQNESVDVPASMVRNASKTYALVVEGQSMIEDGILDGDLLLVQKQSFANNGETVVAMVNNQATVKRFYLHRKRDTNIHSNPQSHAHPPSQPDPQVELRPANSTMSSMWHPPSNVDIQGIVVGLMRRF